MKYPGFEKEIFDLLAEGRELHVEDFVSVFGNMPMPSVYARIRALVSLGKLSVIGKGCYLPCAKPKYSVAITVWMKECNDCMIRELPGVSVCISERGGNLEVLVGKEDIARTVDVLGLHFDRVMQSRDAKLLAKPPKGFVLVGRMITESPLLVEDGIYVPSPEKELVDSICRNEDSSLQFQRILDVYPINMDRLRRYASRRGVADELEARLSLIDRKRQGMFNSVQLYLSKTKVKKAWVFGSFARGEESGSSDLDLLVEYEHSGGLSLLTIIRYQLDIEKLIGRKVDLVEDGYLKPFAKASAERDKYLIYER